MPGEFSMFPRFKGYPRGKPRSFFCTQAVLKFGKGLLKVKSPFLATLPVWLCHERPSWFFRSYGPYPTLSGLEKRL